MLAATHAITGAIIASNIQSPLTAGLLALATHPLLDLVPHWDLNTRWVKRSKFRVFASSLIDAFVGFGIGILLFSKFVSPPLLLFVMLMAQLPDWLEAPYHFGFKFPPFTSIKKLQSLLHNKAPLPWGLLPQLAILFFAIYLA